MAPYLGTGLGIHAENSPLPSSGVPWNCVNVHGRRRYGTEYGQTERMLPIIVSDIDIRCEN